MSSADGSRLRQVEEVSILRDLSLHPHKHVLSYIDSWETPSPAGKLYIRTELAECGDLSRFLFALGDTGGLGEARVWKTLFELSSALEHIHARGYLHLDIKPSNVLITRDGGLKMGDFGMSTLILGEGTMSPALPDVGQDGRFEWLAPEDEGRITKSPIIDREVEGDREYLCPEALEGNVGIEADVFS